MVSMMDVEPSKGQICDSRPTLVQSAVSQRSVELQMPPRTPEAEVTKKTLKLNLKSAYPVTSTPPGQPVSEIKGKTTIKSPKSPLGNSGVTIGNRVLPHQTSLTAQIDLVEDRKALRDALYQGIFHRHRRTIFALGSFIRMLKTRNSSYNTIRSSSEGDEEGR
ncbi:uncharacterized protein LOC129799098 isoform X2 [Phlebotomus papatasi]|uniref:uncharacterized protein LOC129799098 isoform X2 n=1 Tax=Phlebotomus papatasi TaxID=29031 RepID=UPI0024842012|nr:uncharacterized protein LOC129799098 isoform X2 [Phlebotomus papatasi]